MARGLFFTTFLSLISLSYQAAIPVNVVSTESSLLIGDSGATQSQYLSSSLSSVTDLPVGKQVQQLLTQATSTSSVGDYSGNVSSVEIPTSLQGFSFIGGSVLTASSSIISSSVNATKTTKNNTDTRSASSKTASKSTSTSNSSSNSTSEIAVGSDWASQLILIFNIYSQIKDGGLTGSSLLLKGSSGTLSGSAKSVDLFKQIVTVLQPNATSSQKSVIDSITASDMSNVGTLQKKLFNNSGMFRQSFGTNGILYSKINTFRGAYEAIAAELPDVTNSVTSNRVTWLKNVATNIEQVSTGRYYAFKDSFAGSGVSISSYGITYNDTSNYIKFESSSSYSSLSSAITAYNKKAGGKSTLNVDVIQDCQISSELWARVTDLINNASGNT
ncbi:hypothetical protein DASC09_031920 [Saccharomycopsis crataegensis]|uniref:Uncharacterized protein n=1 Tax=Saccharomycopsis crataegensis TaxID=43959 RepID=A0AAV5QMM3_9ASCO|nr:hypothetical protein DASC09_031920 [Saccharomycopsis crataegensis]